MTSYTPNLKLLKKNPSTDGNDTFNIETMLNDNWDKVDEEFGKKADKKTHIVYIEESQNWVVPDGVIEIDVFIVNSGCDGESGKTATTNSYFYLAGSGGNGGAVCYVQNFKVESEQVCPVVVGVNGGISSFCDLTPSNDGSVGGEQNYNVNASVYKKYTGNPGNYSSFQDCNGIPCPIDGKLYAISGSSGGYGIASNSSDAGSLHDVVGIAGKNTIDSLPTGGGSAYYLTGSRGKGHIWGGNGGASYDNNGTAGIYSTSGNVGGNGGDAITYGCGGGGGGGGGGIGGTGAQGVVIIAY